jgi:hypothetical protein
MTEKDNKLRRLRDAGIPVEQFNDQVIEQIATLDDAEIQTLADIKAKLDEGKDPTAVDAVGVIIW